MDIYRCIDRDTPTRAAYKYYTYILNQYLTSNRTRIQQWRFALNAGFFIFSCLYFILLHLKKTPITIEIRKYCNRQTNGVHVDEDVENLVNLDDGRRGLVIKK